MKASDILDSDAWKRGIESSLRSLFGASWANEELASLVVVETYDDVVVLTATRLGLFRFEWSQKSEDPRALQTSVIPWDSVPALTISAETRGGEERGYGTMWTLAIEGEELREAMKGTREQGQMLDFAKAYIELSSNAEGAVPS